MGQSEIFFGWSENPIDTAEQICYTSKQIGGGSPVTNDSEVEMNEARRKTLTGTANDLAALVKEIGASGLNDWEDKLQAIKDEIEQIKDDEDEALENMAENLKSGEKASRMSEVINELDEAMGSIDEILESIVGAKEWVTGLDDIIAKVEAAKE